MPNPPPTQPATAAVIVAAGRGERLGVPHKVLLPIAGRPLLGYVLDTVEACPAISRIVVVIGPHTRSEVTALLANGPWTTPVHLAEGGATRHDSVVAGLAAVPGEFEFVAIHDGARPFASPVLFADCLDAAIAHGAAIAAIPVADTLKRVSDGLITATVDRSGLWAAQTPQVFRRADLLAALAAPHDAAITDEAALFEALGRPVAVVPGAATNLKLTHPGDVALAESVRAALHAAADSAPPPAPGPTIRTGIGYDAHVFAPDRRLVLGGVVIPHDAGLLGHSDADVLLHAIADALLGAAALGDIGHHFPPSDPAFKDADSLELLRQVREILVSARFATVNVDATIIAEAPRIGPHVLAMRSAIATCLQVPVTAVSVKATTNERMGALGRGEGIAAFATATISSQGSIPTNPPTT